MKALIRVTAMGALGRRLDFGHILEVELGRLLRRSNMEYEGEESRVMSLLGLP